MPLEIENKLETGLKSLLENVAYFKNNSISIREFRDNSEVQTSKYLIVHAKPATRLFPSAPAWKVNMELIACSNTPNDTDRSECEAIYNNAFDFITNLSAASLSTASGLSIDAILDAVQEGEEDTEDNLQIKTIKSEIYLQAS